MKGRRWQFSRPFVCSCVDFWSAGPPWPWRTWPCASNWPSSSGPSNAPHCANATASSGPGYRGCVGLEVRLAHRPARHRDALASPGLPALLAMEVPEEAWEATGRSGDPRSDPPHVPGESDLGRSANLVRTSPAGSQGRGVHSGPRVRDSYARAGPARHRTGATGKNSFLDADQTGPCGAGAKAGGADVFWAVMSKKSSSSGPVLMAARGSGLFALSRF